MDIQWTAGLTLKQAECQLLRTALIAHDFDIRATSRALGVCRATIYKKHLEHFGISVPELRRRLAAQSIEIKE